MTRGVRIESNDMSKTSTNEMGNFFALGLLLITAAIILTIVWLFGVDNAGIAAAAFGAAGLAAAFYGEIKRR